MRFLLQSVICLTLLSIAYVHKPALASNLRDVDVQMYRSGDFAKAAQYFEAEVAANPKDATAHYFLGNVFIALKRIDDAVQEYRRSLALEPDGLVAQYCKQALSSLANHALDATTTPRTNSSMDKSAKSANADELSAIKHSTLDISTETNETEQKLSAEGLARVKQIFKELDEKVGVLEREMHDRIAANGEAIHQSRFEFGRLVQFTTYDPAEDNQAIRDEYDLKISALREAARKKAEEVTVAYKQRESSLENSAIGLNKSYINNQQNKSLKLNPSGTNIFVRSYETEGEASGSPVPVLASPAKALPEAHSNKASPGQNSPP